jgi:RHS repeat-associated protein
VDEEMQGTTVTADYSAGAEKLSGTLYWMLADGQGSTRQLLNSSQATVASYTTDAFGNSVSSSGTAANPFQWNGGIGYYSDSESGLQKVGARYYEPSTGRWSSQDSLLIAGSPVDSQAVNRYLYCGANPVAHYDANGHGGGLPDIEIFAYEVVGAILTALGATMMIGAEVATLTFAIGALLAIGGIALIACGIYLGLCSARAYADNDMSPSISNQAAGGSIVPGDGYGAHG